MKCFFKINTFGNLFLSIVVYCLPLVILYLLYVYQTRLCIVHYCIIVLTDCLTSCLFPHYRQGFENHCKSTSNVTTNQSIDKLSLYFSYVPSCFLFIQTIIGIKIKIPSFNLHIHHKQAQNSNKIHVCVCTHIHFYQNIPEKLASASNFVFNYVLPIDYKEGNKVLVVCRGWRLLSRFHGNPNDFHENVYGIA